MKSITKSAFAIFGVALMVMVALVPMIGVFNEGSEAAAKEYVDNVNITLYNADDDLSDMVYRGTNLPAGLDPAEWIPFSAAATSTWRNVNELSDDYSELLTMGMAGLTHDQAVKAVIDSGLTFPMVEVTWFQLEDMGDASVFMKVLKGTTTISQASAGIPGNIELGPYPLVRNGAYFDEGLYGVSTNLLTNTSVAGEIFIDNTGVFKTGKYSVELSYEGKVIGTASTSYVNPDDPDEYVTISGIVTDYNGTPASANGIPGAVVEYKITTNGVSTTGTTKAATGDSLLLDVGEFVIIGPSGSAFEITKVSAPGFTFEGLNYSYNYGTLIDDPDARQFMAKNGTTLVKYTVKDQDKDVELDGIAVTASIYYGIKTVSTDKYNYSTTAPAGITAGNVNLVTTVTDLAGDIYISYNAPTGAYTPVDDTAYLGSFVYLKAQAAQPFTFDYGVKQFVNLNAAIVAPVDKGDSWQSVPAAATLISLEMVGEVTVKDAAGAEPVLGTTVTGKWYYQSGAGTYTFTDSKPSTVNAGKLVMLNNGKTIGGVATFVFIAPTNQTEPVPETEYTFFMYFTTSDVTPFTFTKTTIPATADQPFNTLVNSGADGDYAYTAAGGIDGLLKANQTVKEVTITIAKPAWKTSGDIVITHTDALTAGRTICIEDRVNPAAVEIPYTFHTIVGKAPVVTITCDGFDVKNGAIDYAKGYAMATVTGNVALAAAMTIKDFSTVERSALGTYDIPVESAAAVTTFTFTIGEVTAAAKTYAVQVLGVNPSFTVYGKATEVPEVAAVVIDGDEVETVTFDGTTPVIETLYTYVFVTTVAVDPTAPSISEVVGGIDVTAKDGLETVFQTTTGLDGKAVVVSTYDPVHMLLLDFSVYGLNVDVALVLEGPYAGCYSIDVGDVIPEGITAIVTPEITGAAVGHAAIRGIAVGANEYAIGTVLTLVADNEYYNDQSGQTGYATLTEKVVFKGWYADGKLISSEAVTSYTVSGSVVITPVYESVELIDSTPKAVEQGGIDNTTLIIGIVAIVIALIAVAFVIISLKKKDA